MTIATLRLASTLEGPLASGHPWVYRNHLPSHALRTGDVVRLEAGRSASYGIYDDHGAIAVRLFGTALPDDALVAHRVDEALAARASLLSGDHDAYRLVNGEGDYLPGIVVDRYGRYAVVKSYSTAMRRLLPVVARQVGTRLRLKGVALRGRADETPGDPVADPDGGRDAEPGSDADPLTPLWGELPPPEVTVRENGMVFVADLRRGQKTGLFLDQRENRALVGAVSRDRKVLNLFAYNGGFSVYALAGGARSVTSVDVSAGALEAAERNVHANGLDPDKHVTEEADLFAALPTWVGSRDRYDMVVLDPPSLANAAAQRRRALRAYLRLNRDAMRLVEPGGLLATASCTAQVTPEAFKEMLADAARAAGVRAQIVAERGHAMDHPVPLAFPEGRYLKFVLLRLLPA
ncbi:MAG: class I SAM-dependent rRNA methyltransferase [Trueperaceae bacterium]